MSPVTFNNRLSLISDLTPHKLGFASQALIKNSVSSMHSAFYVFEDNLKKTMMLLKDLLKYSKVFSVFRKICKCIPECVK